MASNYKMTYNVDLVFCIDATGSMTPLIDMVKQNALKFHPDLTAAMAAKDKKINELRIRIIAFRDYIADGNNAMLITNFFSLPADSALLTQGVNSIQAFGGGDDPEDGLEALGFAIQSPWNNDSTAKRRQVIVVWTDDGTHDLGYGKSAANYPSKMAKDFAELTEWWGDSTLQIKGYVDNSSKRLLLYAPDKPAWNIISSNWENVLHYPSIAGQGLKGCTYNEIIDAIAQTISL